MTDRELLELAARAAGYTYFHDGYDNYMHYPCIEVDGFPVKWEPLADDGDALRLAVKLGMHVCPGVARDADGNLALSDATDDVYAATRDAIVMAAAEIGRAMK